MAAAAVAALLVPALGSSAGPAGRKPGPLGMVPPQGKPAAPSRLGASSTRSGATSSSLTLGPTSADNLTYGQIDQLAPATEEPGPVMHTSRVYAMYWDPNGTLPASYAPTIDQFFSDVAADSGKSTNVYSAAIQYYDTTGGITYDAQFLGSAVDTDPFPADGCTVNQSSDWTVNGLDHCLSDPQLQAEIQSFADAQGWQHGPDVQIFVFTPQNVGSCIDDPFNFSFGQDCSYSDYCAYHSAFASGGTHDVDPADEYIYANMPWPIQDITSDGTDIPSDCDTGEHPNGSGSSPSDQNAADDVINVTSHEHNEAITDPLGTGWWVDTPDSFYSGQEDGDLCSWYFPNRSLASGSPALGHGGAYTQVINQHHYFVQGEWSNRDATRYGYSGCVWGYGYAANVILPSLSGTSEIGQTLTASAGSWAGSPTKFKFIWLRCAQPDTNCAVVRTVTTSSPTSTYTLTVADVRHAIQVQVVGVTAKGASPAAVPSGVADMVTGEPALAASPTPTGATTVGSTITLAPGSWTTPAGYPVSRYVVTWQRCTVSSGDCVAFRTSSLPASKPITYRPAAADDKKRIEATVKAINAAGASDPVTVTIGVITGEPEPTASPSISGTPAVGNTLTATAGTFAPAPSTYVFRWERCDSLGGNCTALTWASNTTGTPPHYRVGAADRGHALRLEMLGVNKAGTSDPVLSNALSVPL